MFDAAAARRHMVDGQIRTADVTNPNLIAAMAAVPNRSYLEVHGFGLDRFIAAPLRIEAGFAIAPDRPGHGIEFDWKGLDALRVAT